MFGGRLGMTELLLILVVALIFFGPKKLPELGKSLGSALREFKKSTKSVVDEVESAANDDPSPAAGASPQAPLPGAPASKSAGPAAGDKRN